MICPCGEVVGKRGCWHLPIPLVPDGFSLHNVAGTGGHQGHPRVLRAPHSSGGSEDGGRVPLHILFLGVFPSINAVAAGLDRPSPPSAGKKQKCPMSSPGHGWGRGTRGVPQVLVVSPALFCSRGATTKEAPGK